MSKRRILAVAMSLCIVAILAVGASLAYFTDTETKKNTFTVGKVDITLNEKGADGEDFVQDQKLYPGTQKQNAITKSVTVTNNEGSEDAYLWIEVWIPSALDDGDDNSPAAPGLKNSLHMNYNGSLGVIETKATYLGSKTIDGVSYNGYVHYIKDDTAKKAGESTKELFQQVYMDKGVTQVEGGYLLIDGKTVYDGPWEVIINGVGMQANGFDKITDAITAYYKGKDVTAHIF